MSRVGALRMCNGTGALGSARIAACTSVYALYTATDLGAMAR
eukprot:CAMPEP_0182901406 /NCGR_PEP_ID=MMETSP0034_2-20130328/29632_1 /TAXON_ID=156128 /ORGANISM="Nephroselmis pyriformis, Strain CCMP717" /LENGTH=41 /DNA_ID= /DNA_START= /DNA_END= /DNA_ORIENTATION=